MNQQSNSVKELLDFLFSLHRFGIKPGLERIEYLLKFLGNPEKKFPIIHIAGTNGKGSVCSMLAAMLQSAGYKTGLYTSPHLLSFNERIRVNGIMIPDESLARLSAIMMDEIKKEHTTFFEVTTAMAFAYFAEQEVDIAIIETGMGGRLDGTNVVEHPLATVITSIDIDHAEYLGNTLVEIAGEKAGIFKKDAPVIIGEKRKELQEFFQGFSLHKKTGPVFIVDDCCTASNVSYDTTLSMYFDCTIHETTYKRLELDKAGNHQVQNAITALLTLQAVQHAFPVDDAAIRKGMKYCSEMTGVKGRIQLLKNNPPVVLDVGHNPACLQQLHQTLTLCGYEHTQWQIVFAAMADKPIQEMLEILNPLHASILCCAPHMDRAMKSDALCALATNMSLNAYDCGSVNNAIEIAMKSKKPVLITGSFYLADEAIVALQRFDISI